MRAMLRAAVAACLLVGLLAVWLFIVTIPALAADTGGPPASPAHYLDDVQAPPAVHNRTAFYVTALAGLDVAQYEAASFNFSQAAWLAGAAAGVNFRLPSSPFVVGLEGDYVWTDVKATPGLLVVATTHYLASLRARAGLGIGPALFYLTAGPGFTDKQFTTVVVDKSTSIGLAAGGGVEAELTKALFVRLEALHYAFPDDNSTSCGVACLYKSSAQETTVRLGVGFKLN